MLNYIKSECYRVIHSRSTYVMTGIMAVLPVLFHIILYVTGVASSITQDFPYDITSFSFSFLTGSPMLFTYAGLIVAAVLYEDEHKNGNLKNAVAFGISREKLFLGKCITAVLTATVYGTDKPKNYFNRGSGSVWNSSWIDDPWDRISVIFSK